MTIDPDFAVIRNLNDAGCDVSTREKFLQFRTEGNTGEQLRLLQRQRTMLLNNVHENQKRIDCLDHLVFSLKQDKL